MAKPKYNTENHNKATNSLWLIADINHMIASLRSFTCIKTTSILSLVLNIFLFLFHYRVIAWLIHNTVTWTIRRLNFYFLINYSAWIQVNSGINIPIRAVFKTSNGFKHAGATIAQSNCWSMLKGGLTVDVSGPAHLYFEVRTYFKFLSLLVFEN